MAKRTAINRVCKGIINSSDDQHLYRDAIARTDEDGPDANGEGEIPADSFTVIDGEEVNTDTGEVKELAPATQEDSRGREAGQEDEAGSVLMKIESFGSSSAGNCYRVSDRTTSLLLEAGLPLKKIRVATGHQLSALAGCLVSHEHGDHSKAVGSSGVRRPLLHESGDC